MFTFMKTEKSMGNIFFIFTLWAGEMVQPLKARLTTKKMYSHSAFKDLI